MFQMKTIKLIFTFSCLYFGTSSTISTSTEAEVATIEDTSNDEPFTDLLLIGTADGMLTAFDDKQNEKWTLDTGGSIATSYNIDDDDNHFSVHPGIDGNVYIGTRQGMTKTSVKARMIAEKAPFVSTQDNLFFTGQKTNRILGVDVRNGKIIHDSSIIGSKLSRGLDGSLITTRVDGSKRAPLWVGRTEYSFRAFDRDTGLEHFNLTYSEIGPLNSLASDDDAPASDLYDSLDPSDYGIRQQSLPSTLDKSTQLQKSYALDADRLSTFKGSPIVNSFSLNKLHAGDVHDTDTHELFSVKSLRINPLKLSGQPLRDPRFVDNTVGQDNKDFKKSFQEKSLQALPSGTEQFLINDVNSILGTESRTDESSPTRRKSTALTALRDSGPRSRSATVPLLKLRDDSTPTVLSLNQVALVDNNEDIGDDDSNGIPIDNDLIRSKERLLHGNNNGRLCVLKSNHNIGKEGDLMPICKSDSRLRPALLAGLSNVDDSGLPHFAQLKYYQSTFSEDLIKYRGFSRAYSNSDSKSKSVLRRILAIITELVASVLGLTIFTLFAVYILQRVGFLSIETTRDMYAAVMRLILLAYGDDALRLRISPSLVVEKSDNAEAIEEDDGFGGKITKVGSLVLTQHVLGYGSSGTVVFLGNLNGRAVAVKRLLTQFNFTAEREIGLLIRSDGHPNVVRYFLSERRGDFVYLCLQLCAMSLKDFIVRLQNYRQTRQKTDAGSTDDGLLASTPVRKALLQIAEGLSHLHSHRIVHRDLKPHNILCALPESENDGSRSYLHMNLQSDSGNVTSVDQIGDYILKISDMGLSKQLSMDQDSVSGMSFSMPAGEPSLTSKNSVPDAHPVGTIGWQAPELIVLRGQTVCKDEPIISTNDDADIDDEDDEVDNRSDNNGDKIDGSIEPRTRSQSLSAASDSILIESEVSVLKAKSEKSRFRPQSVDIFSLGCVFHYVISCGLHPFGLWYEREANIVQGKPNLSVLSSLPDALDLVRRMTSNDPKTRPSAKQVCHHPFFWTFQRRLDFFIQLSDRLELLPADAPAVLHIESDALALLGRGWDRKFDSRLLEDMGRYRKYDSCSVRDLLRVIRNKRNHYNELSDEMKDVTGDLPAGFLSYFETRFPKLLMHCVQVCCTHYSDPNVEKELGPYCLHIASLFRSPAVTMNSASAIASIRSVHGSINTVSTNISLKSQDFGVNDSRYESISDSVALRTNSAVIEEGDAKENMTIVSPDVSDLVVWWGGALAETCNVRGWWRDDVHWITQPGLNKIAKQRPSHIARSATDSKYRSRLCTHWELTQECAFRKKGKCDFAHYPIELRIKDTRRDKWNAALQQKQQHGKLIIPSIADTSVDWLKSSGGEDVLSAARSIEKIRSTTGR